MTATTVGPRIRPAGRRLLEGAVGVPRLLLPPAPEPPGVPLTAALEGSLAARCRSVLSPLTEQQWCVAPTSPPPPAAELPDPKQVCGAVVLAAVEALRSARPLAQLTRWVTSEVFEALARAATPATPNGNRARAVVRGVRICRIGPDVAEGSVVIHDGPRVRAAAVRLEAHRGAWRVTALQIG